MANLLTGNLRASVAPWETQSQWRSEKEFVIAESIRTGSSDYDFVLARRSRSQDIRWEGLPQAGWSWAENAPVSIKASEATLNANHYCLVISNGQQPTTFHRPAFKDSLFVGMFQKSQDPQNPWEVLPTIFSLPHSVRARILDCGQAPNSLLGAKSAVLCLNQLLLECAAANRHRRANLRYRHADVRREVFRSLLAAQSYIHSHLAIDTSLDAMADSAQLSRSHFSRTFRDAFDVSATAYVSQVRFRRALCLIRESDLPLNAILAEVGWSSAPSFCRQFKSRFGMSSENFRKKVRQDNTFCDQRR